jgi:hypothetical protein
MIIGNFDEADSVNGILVNPEGLDPYAFYFIDEVHVETFGEPQGLADIMAGWQGSILWLRWPADAPLETVELFDMAGRRVFRSNGPLIDLQIQWELPGLANGVYVIRVLQGAQQRTLKVIKEGEW